MPAKLQVTVTNLNNGTVIIALIGEARLDVEDAAFQLDRVIVHHPKFVIVDCSQLTFLSSIGMSLFVNLRRTIHKIGGIVALASVQPQVRDTLKHACLLERFQHAPTLESALAAPSASPAAAPTSPTS